MAKFRLNLKEKFLVIQREKCSQIVDSKTVMNIQLMIFPVVDRMENLKFPPQARTQKRNSFAELQGCWGHYHDKKISEISQASPRKMCVVLLRYRVLPSEPFAVRRDTSNSTENGISLLIWLFRVLHDIKNLRRISQALSSLPNNEMCWAFTVLSHPHLWKMKDLFDFFSSHPNPIKEERNLMIPQWIPQSGNPFVRLVWASYESLLTASWRMSDLFERCLVFSKAKWV